jgi:hypothetical protein
MGGSRRSGPCRCYAPPAMRGPHHLDTIWFAWSAFQRRPIRSDAEQYAESRPPGGLSAGKGAGIVAPTQVACLPGSQRRPPRVRSAISVGICSRSVASVSFQRLRKPKAAITAMISTISSSE